MRWSKQANVVNIVCERPFFFKWKESYLWELLSIIHRNFIDVLLNLSCEILKKSHLEVYKPSPLLSSVIQRIFVSSFQYLVSCSMPNSLRL